MKKKVLCAIGVAAFAVAVAVNINASLSNSAEMDVALANVEALARSEGNYVTSCYQCYWMCCIMDYSFFSGYHPTFG